MKMNFFFIIYTNFSFSSLTKDNRFFFMCFKKSYKDIVYKTVNINYKVQIQLNYLSFCKESPSKGKNSLKQEGIELKFFREMLDRIFTFDFEFLPKKIWVSIISRHKKELMLILVNVLAKEKIEKKLYSHISQCLKAISHYIENIRIDDDELEIENKSEYLLDYMANMQFEKISQDANLLMHQNTRTYLSQIIQKKSSIEYIKTNYDKTNMINDAIQIIHSNIKQISGSNIIFMFQLNFSILFLNHFISKIYKKDEYKNDIDKVCDEMKKYADLLKLKCSGRIKKILFKTNSKKQKIFITIISPCANYFAIFFRHLNNDLTEDINKIENFLQEMNTMIIVCNKYTELLMEKINEM